MKKICLIRHAHTPPGNPDQERELSVHGIKQAQWMGRRLSTSVTAPDSIVCSPAMRTRQTARFVSESFGLKGTEARFEKPLYESTLDDYLDIIHGLEENAGSVWLIGHNWAISALAQYLAGENRLDMAPCTAIFMAFETEEWRLVRPANRLETIIITPPESGDF